MSPDIDAQQPDRSICILRCEGAWPRISSLGSLPVYGMQTSCSVIPYSPVFEPYDRVTAGLVAVTLDFRFVNVDSQHGGIAEARVIKAPTLFQVS